MKMTMILSRRTFCSLGKNVSQKKNFSPVEASRWRAVGWVQLERMVVARLDHCRVAGVIRVGSVSLKRGEEEEAIGRGSMKSRKKSDISNDVALKYIDGALTLDCTCSNGRDDINA